LFIPKLIKVAEGSGLSYEDLIFCLPKEILDKKIPDIKVINQRKKGYAILVQDGVPKCFEGIEFLRIKSHLEGEIIFSGNINGAVAYKGVVSGEVFLVNESNFNDIKEGAVLVTSMTVPSMLPAMKIASAFITDEGGITCHASIIARELKKPCIIGTKIATKVLKDGDLVEVNANEGFVRIIK
jgi:phosphoenolpyruvate synthase/pyruvate phosphate dikinase